MLSRRYVCTQGNPDQACGSCVNCHKVDQWIHPDVIQAGWGDKPATVEQVRTLRSDAYILPNEAKRKVYLIDQADQMHHGGLNALLKLLEEGPSYGAFLLLCQQEALLLPTIRSRCEHIRLTGEAISDPKQVEQATSLLSLAIHGDELAWTEYCIGLEKLSRDDWSGLLEECLRQLLHLPQPDLSQSLLVSMADLLQEICASLTFNLGSGHVAGWLAAGMMVCRSHTAVR